jgi:hypothetical protein
MAGKKERNKLKFLFSCLGGSHLYGTTTPTSDRDIKHIVLPDLDSLLLGVPIKNVQKKTNTEEFRKNGVHDVDEEFIPLQVFARDFLCGQTYALELAYAVEGTGAEQNIYDDLFLTFCRELRSRFLTSDIHAMSRYAVRQAEIYSAKGDRLNTALAAKSLFDQFPNGNTVNSYAADFNQEALKLEAHFPDTFQITEYDVNGKGQMAPCVKLLDRVLPYSATFGYLVNQIDAIIKKYGDRVKEASGDSVDWKATMHAFRILNEGAALLSGEGLSFPYDKDYRDTLLRIRRGEVPYEEVAQRIGESLFILQQIAENSPFPKLTQELKDDLEAWLLKWLKVFYGIKTEEVVA